MNTQELIEKLQWRMKRWHLTGDPAWLKVKLVELLAVNQALIASQERERVLREALAPFADAADDLDESHSDGHNVWESPAAMSIYAGCLRNAKEVFQSTEQQG